MTPHTQNPSDAHARVEAQTHEKCLLTLTQTEYIVHPLEDVARSRLCCVDLEFGSERVSGILDTGAQSSLLNTSCYERMKTEVPPLLQPLPGARGFVGASGKQLTVHGGGAV